MKASHLSNSALSKNQRPPHKNPNITYEKPFELVVRFV